MLLPDYVEKEKPKILSDPRIIGPGIWMTIHIKAMKAVDEATKRDFIDYMWFTAETFPCMNCRNHINQYLKHHPIEHLYNLKNDKGEEIGMFKWSWMFHNAVNTRLNKPYMDWNTAWEMYNSYRYDNIAPCTKDCGEDGKKVLDKKTDQIIQGYFINKGINETINRFS